MAISKFQSFVTETISRKEIKNADYNPRIMDKEAKKRLRANLKEHGLVSSITWNKRTGNIVGGHQRLEQLDTLEKNTDYDLTVCVVDVPEKEEAKLNVLLNNPSMQGDWDFDKLANMSEDFSISLADMGFTKSDVDFMFDGDDRFSDLYETEEAHAMKNDLEKIKAERQKGAQLLKDRNNINFYCIVVFEDENEKKKFFKEINIPVNEECITLEQLKRIEK